MSPTVFNYQGYRFFFFSREETRIHIHVYSGDGEAKYWVEPKVELTQSIGFNSKQLNAIQCIVEEHRDEIIEAWSEHFKS